jgi:4-diphosphocytidyl-2-C-methyl-D-erythritol kinase
MTIHTSPPSLSTNKAAPGGPWAPLDIAAPAKINLYLRVVAKRHDGYHEIETLFCPVGLYDHLKLSPGDGEGIEIHCDADHVPSDATNLAHRAATLYLSALAETGRRSPTPGVHIDLRKQIPVGAGLGGGSSDAAAVLRGLNQLHGSPFDNDRLRDLAFNLGADCPFFVDARPAFATGLGEKLQPVLNLPKYQAIIIYPGLHVTTAEVYKKLNLRLTKRQKKINYSHFTGSNFDVRRGLFNDLETVTANAHPEIDAAKSLLNQNGALGALMSGSGSCVFGLFTAVQDARRALAAMPRYSGWRYFLAPLLV